MFPYIAFLKSLMESRKVDKMNREQLEALQLKKLQGLVAFAMEKCPFYAELYGKAGIR